MYASQYASPRPTQHSVPAGDQPLPDRIDYLSGPKTEGLQTVASCYISPPSPSFLAQIHVYIVVNLSRSIITTGSGKGIHPHLPLKHRRTTLPMPGRHPIPCVIDDVGVWAISVVRLLLENCVSDAKIPDNHRPLLMYGFQAKGELPVPQTIHRFF